MIVPTLEYRPLGRWKYLVTRPIRIYIPELDGLPPIIEKYYSLIDGDLVAGPGYAWNGANWIRDSKDLMIAALFHDLGYQMMKEGHLLKSWRKLFDILLREIYRSVALRLWRKEHGKVSWIKRWKINRWATIIYTAVRAGGGFTINKTNYPTEKIITI